MLLFLLYSLFISSIIALQPSRPLIYWTSSSEPKHVFDDATFKVRNIMTRTDPEKEKLTFAFLFDDLDLSSLQKLKSKVQNNPLFSSVFMPFVTGKFTLSGTHVGTRMSSWEDFVTSYDGKKDIVVFEPQDETELASLFENAQEFGESSNKPVAFMVTASSPKELPTAQSPYKGVVFSEFALTAEEYNTTSQYVGPQSVTPFTIQALIVCTLLFFGMCIGNTCLSEVQVPITYLHKELPIRKEY